MKQMITLFLAVNLLTYPRLVEANSATYSFESKYEVGLDDILEVTVLRPEKISQVVTVGPDGTISFPYIGTVYVEGYNLNQIKHEIEERLSGGWLKYPEVSLALKESHSKNFYISGDVLKPGRYPVDANTTILKAISIAGGFKRPEAISQVKIVRVIDAEEKSQLIQVNIKEMMSRPSKESGLYVLPNDTILVSEDRFYVYGAVAHPGTFPMEENITVMKAISIVGGLSKFGSHNKVKIFRPKKNQLGYDAMKIDLKGIMDGSNSSADIPLQPGDTIVVMEGMF